MTPTIDLAHLDQYVCGDNALLDEILTIYEDQAELWLARLQPSQDDEDWRNAAHALKGASRGVGAWAVGDLCEAAEALVAGAPEKAARRRSLLADLTVKLGAAISEARAIRGAL